MGDFSTTISQMSILILIACMGFVSAKVGYIDADMRSKLTKILVNITLPCMIVISANDLDASSIQDSIPIAFLLAAAQFALLLVVGFICNATLRIQKKERSLYLFMAICTNSAFIGLPMISSLYGGETVLFASIFVMVLAFFMYSVGFAILSGHEPIDNNKTQTPLRKAMHKIQTLPWRSIINPSMLSCGLAIIMLLIGFKVPSTLAGAMDTLGSVTSPIAMMLVGSIVADADIRNLFNEPKMYLVILIRQLVVPICLLFGLRLIGISDTLTVVFIIMFAMPIGSMASTFAEQFNRNASLAAKGTVLSTLASFIIIPVLVALMTTPQ